MKIINVGTWCICLCLLSCNGKPDLEQEEKKIRALLADEQRAHLEGNVELFAREFSDSMISVNRGNIRYTPPDTMRKSIQRYFGSTRILRWEDLSPPRIRFSADGSLVYVLVQKEVIVQYPDAAGVLLNDTARYAWASVLRK